MNAAKPTRRWFHPTPGWLVLASLLLTGLLYLSERFRWFGFNQHKGWTVLIAVASVIAMLAVMLFWWLAALVFRQRFQFSIRSLLMLAVAVAVPCSWLAVEMKKARGQRAIVERIVKLGGTVKYDTTYCSQDNMLTRDGFATTNYQPPSEHWLADLLGDSFFANVTYVLLRGVQVTDAEIMDIKDLTALHELWLVSTQVTDAGLETLKGLTALQALSLENTQITDAGLAHLKGLTALKELDLDRTKVTSAGLGDLKALTSLQVLWLGNTQISDSGLENLRETDLRVLYLINTRVTNAGLEKLKGLTSLEILDLSDTEVTDTGVEKLQQALPNCHIVH